ncbi:hypothetical protein HJC23_006283, partial [Cyclotella cryptica]
MVAVWARDSPTKKQHVKSCNYDSNDDGAISPEEEDELPPAPANAPPTASAITSDRHYHNKQCLLLISSRGATGVLSTLIPHAKKESKLDMGGYGAAVNEIAEVRDSIPPCSWSVGKGGRTAIFGWGGRGHANSQMQMAESTNAPSKHLMISGGPSVKFHIDIHTMDELKLTGNCMKGYRPILSFDLQFSSNDPNLSHLQIIKHLMIDVFGTPRGHPKSKPFVDRVMAFYYADGK